MANAIAWCRSPYTLAQGGWVLVQSADNAGSSTLAFGSGNTVHNLLVLGVVMNSTGTVTPTDSAGNTWVLVDKAIYDGSAKSCQLFYVADSLAGANTVTATGAVSIHLFEFSCTVVSAPYTVDVSSKTADNSTGGSAGENALTGVSLTTTALDDMVVAVVGRKNGNAGVGTNIATWQSPGGDVSGLLEYFTQLQLGSVQANAYDTAATDPYGIVTAAFKSANVILNIWPSNPTPGETNAADSTAGTWGCKFKSSVAGNIIGIRFYKGTLNTSAHTIGLYRISDTSLMASKAVSGETASGWQTMNFDTPVAIAANTDYIACYYSVGATSSLYSDDVAYFSSTAPSGVDSGPLHAYGDGEISGGNGVYNYSGGAIGIPNQTFNATNYWVDVIFKAT
jgi:hypothetical protein